ncbi:MAG TPA: TetR/AcrR family transcriptional regulator [Marmoricola sp.]|nr:TetR/AcrR family transcriptional regulator [Marmoricola sp.]
MTTSARTIEGYKHGRVPREVRERQMLDVAEEVFTEFGYAGASIEEVCRRAGLKRPIVYTYFGGKDGLYLGCYRRARAELDERLATAALGVQTDERTPEALHSVVRAVIRGYFEFLASSPGRWDLLYGPGAATERSIAAETSALRMQTVELLAALLRGYAPSGAVDDVVLGFAHAASGSCEQLARWARQNEEITLDQLVDLGTRYNWTALTQLLLPD